MDGGGSWQFFLASPSCSEIRENLIHISSICCAVLFDISHFLMESTSEYTLSILIFLSFCKFICELPALPFDLSLSSLCFSQTSSTPTVLEYSSHRWSFSYNYPPFYNKIFVDIFCFDPLTLWLDIEKSAFPTWISVLKMWSFHSVFLWLQQKFLWKPLESSYSGNCSLFTMFLISSHSSLVYFHL